MVSVLPKVLNLDVLPFITLALIIKMIGIWCAWMCACIHTCICFFAILLSNTVEMLIIQWLCSHLGINFIYQAARCLRFSGRALLAAKTLGSIHQPLRILPNRCTLYIAVPQRFAHTHTHCVSMCLGWATTAISHTLSHEFFILDAQNKTHHMFHIGWLELRKNGGRKKNNLSFLCYHCFISPLRGPVQSELCDVIRAGSNRQNTPLIDIFWYLVDETK